jgi:L-fucose isomerase-like protein
MKKIKLGFAPTRRSIFSAPDAVKYRGRTAKRLEELGVDFVDITDINEEGLLYDDKDVDKIAEKFKKEGVDGLMLPHCNFGTEYVCARLAKKLDVPVLLWGPLDERPEPNGVRLRDTQCGLFATGKVLRRFQIPFTYLTNCRLSDPVFERGVKDFLAVCNVVKTFKNIRILQISTRPFDFWTTMCNEGELLEKFNIQLAPVPMTELTEEVKAVREDKENMEQMIAYIKDTMVIKIKEEEVEMVAALALAMKSLVEKYGCQAAAIQCWNALQTEIGIMPCAANAILNEQGIPVVCETDIHGAVTALLVEAAGMDEKRGFFADWTIRHPDIANGELLQHCGPWPMSVAQEKPELTYPLAFEHPGSLTAEAKHGEVTLCRFDGDNGEYSLLLGNAKGVDGPKGMGTYLWVEVENIKRLEAKIVEGPYIHHCVGIHKNVVPVLYEACKYIGVKPDLYDPIEEDVKAYLRGE